MVDMAMGQHDFLDRDSGLLSGRLEPSEIAARIDERAAHSLRAPQQSAVLLQRRDRDDRRAKGRLGGAHFHGSVEVQGLSVAVAGASSFIDAATASAWRKTRRRFPPASLAR